MPLCPTSAGLGLQDSGALQKEAWANLAAQQAPGADLASGLGLAVHGEKEWKEAGGDAFIIEEAPRGGTSTSTT